MAKTLLMGGDGDGDGGGGDGGGVTCRWPRTLQVSQHTQALAERKYFCASLNLLTDHKLPRLNFKDRIPFVGNFSTDSLRIEDNSGCWFWNKGGPWQAQKS